MGSDLVASFRAKLGGFELSVDLVAPVGVTAIRGPSGAGKSSLVGGLVGALRPRAGTLRLGDDVWVDVAKGVFVPPERRRLGVVFQRLCLFPHLTALENVTFGLARGAGTTKALGLLDRLGIAHTSARYPRSFSGGEAQRVALARALARDCDVLVLDEPFSALDEPTAVTARGVVREELAANPRIVVMVTHATADVTAFGAREVYVVDGRTDPDAAPAPEK